MKKFLVIGITLLTLISFSNPVWAAGYGESGCGLGSVIFDTAEKQRDPAFQLLSATSNAFFTQSTGITLGTSNCQDSLFKVEREREIFASNNYSTLVREMAAGKGETLDTLAGLYGCSHDSFDDFGTMTQDSFGDIVKNQNTSAKDMLGILKKQIVGHDVLSKSCTG